MKNLCLPFVASLLAMLTACNEKKENPPASTGVIELTAVINGAQQVPAKNTPASGTFSGAYTPADRQLSYTVTYQGITPSFAHIHNGAPGINGSVAIPFVSPLNSPIVGKVTLTSAQADNLLNERMYVNMHTSASYDFVEGEIRGNLRKK